MFRKTLVRIAVVVPLIAIVATILASVASADQNFHTQNIPLMSVDNAPLHTGFVVDIHANGPKIYALERYVLVGALPDTTYQVQLVAFASLTCQGAPAVTVPETTLQTNGAGNGEADKVFTPGDVAGFRNSKFGLIWQILNGANVAYQTGCVVVSTD